MNRSFQTRSKIVFLSVSMLLMSFTSTYSVSLRRCPSQFARLRTKTLRKSFPCPLWSSSFSFCLNCSPKFTSSLLAAGFRAVPSATMGSSAGESLDSNPLLRDFEFPPFDIVEPNHVRRGIRELLRRLEGDLVELERTVEPTWPKLVNPLEKIVDRLQVVWGIVNHLKSVKDSSELRSAIDEVHVRFAIVCVDDGTSLSSPSQSMMRLPSPGKGVLGSRPRNMETLVEIDHHELGLQVSSLDYPVQSPTLNGNMQSKDCLSTSGSSGSNVGSCSRSVSDTEEDIHEEGRKTWQKKMVENEIVGDA